MTRHRSRALTVLALACLLLLTGCGSGPLKEGNTVTPTQAKADVRAVLDDAVTFLGGPTDWSPNQDQNNPGVECTVQDHHGRYYYWDRQGPGPGSEQARDDLAKSLVTRLEKQGYTAYIAERNPGPLKEGNKANRHRTRVTCPWWDRGRVDVMVGRGRAGTAVRRRRGREHGSVSED